MTKHNQVGAINILLIPLIVAIVLLIGAVSFGGWAFSQRNDYKNNTDQKVADAVTIAQQKLSTQKDKDFAEQEKQPLKSYSGPQAYGSISLKYPKTWSAYIDDTGVNSAGLIDGYFYPETVPSLTAASSTFALRIKVVPQAYSVVAGTFASLEISKKVTITPYALPKLPSIVGIRVEGEIVQSKSGSMIILPLRDTTLQIWTENSQFLDDFNKNILPNFSFSP